VLGSPVIVGTVVVGAAVVGGTVVAGAVVGADVVTIGSTTRGRASVTSLPDPPHEATARTATAIWSGLLLRIS
jgi:hypothetical protein